MSRTDARREADALRTQTGRTRAELGQTIQQLASRADIGSRVRAAGARTSDRVRGSVRRAGRHPLPWFVVSAGASALVAVLLLIGARGRRR